MRFKKQYHFQEKVTKKLSKTLNYSIHRLEVVQLLARSCYPIVTTRERIPEKVKEASENNTDHRVINAVTAAVRKIKID